MYPEHYTSVTDRIEIDRLETKESIGRDITIFFATCTLISGIVLFVINTKKGYQYNAYDAKYQEFFILNSSEPLKDGSVVHWNEKVVVDPNGKYTAIIIEEYNQ